MITSEQPPSLPRRKLCFWCGKPMRKAKILPTDPRDLHDLETRDHVIPKSRGGKAKVQACYECNNLKGSMDPYEFRERHRPQVSIEKLRRKLGGEGAHFLHIWEWKNCADTAEAMSA